MTLWTDRAHWNFFAIFFAIWNMYHKMCGPYIFDGMVELTWQKKRDTRANSMVGMHFLLILQFALMLLTDTRDKFQSKPCVLFMFIYKVFFSFLFSMWMSAIVLDDIHLPTRPEKKSLQSNNKKSFREWKRAKNDTWNFSISARKKL